MSRQLFLSSQNRWFYRLALLATILTFALLTLSTYSRLTGSNDACPDWPQCFGSLTVPHTPQQLQLAAKNFPGAVINKDKIRIEMTHRYLIATIGLLVLALTIMAPFFQRQFSLYPFLLCLALWPLMVWEVFLCMLSSSQQHLPLCYLAHFLTGLAILCLLWWISHITSRNASRITHSSTHKLRLRTWLGFMLLLLQIIFSAWVSLNYPGFSCTDFPFCNGQVFPVLNKHLWTALGTPSFRPDQETLINIHLLEQMLIMITSAYLVVYCFFMLFNRYLQRTALLIFALLIAQISLGVLNIVWEGPISVVVGYNAVTLLMLLAVMGLLINLYRRSQDYWYG